MLSPPDSSASPLEWSVALNYGLPDFADQPFLKPSLHVGSSGGKGRREAANKKAPAIGGALTYPDFSTSLGDLLQARVPDPLAELESH